MKISENITPANDTLLVMETESVDEHVSAGGIVLTRKIEIPTARGKVVKVSADYDSKCVVNEGDTVIYGKHKGIPIQLEGGEVVKLIPRNELLAIISV